MALGNDFVVLDAIRQRVELTPEQARRLADRHFGVGCDQILVVEEAPAPGRVDFRYRIFNADGGEVEQCGNGARCFRALRAEQGLSTEARDPRGNAVRHHRAALEDDGRVTVDMGVPLLRRSAIPFDAAGLRRT